MEFYDAVYHMAWLRGITIEKIGFKLGHTSTYIGSAKSRGSLPKVDTAVKILGACDYKLCVVPKGTAPDDAIVIDKPESE